MIAVLSTIFIFIFGLVFGSFLNVLIYRLNVEKAPKFWQGRSFCPKCKHTLGWQDNIPLLSFVLLRGRCRWCRKPISWQYPVVELTTAISFSLIALTAPTFGPLGLLGALTTTASLIVIFFSDLLYGLIPDEMVVVGSIAAAVFNFQFSIFIVGLLTSLGFLTIVLLTRFRGMGLGDVKLAFFMGILLGWPKILVALWTAFVLGGVFAVGLLLLKRTKLSATIALGPFLVIGVLISALWSDQLLRIIGF